MSTSHPVDYGDGRTIAGRQAGRLSERVRERVREQILSGELKPGTVIQIGTLADEVGVSRMPAREALVSLQQAGLLEVIPNRGFIVRQISLADVRDVYVMRRVLEGATSERAATRINDVEKDALVKQHQQARAVVDGSVYNRDFDDLCHSFHRAIATAAESERLRAGVEAIFADVVRLQSIGINPPGRATIVSEHEDVLDAIRAGDAPAARSAMERHIDTLRQVALAAVLD